MGVIDGPWIGDVNSPLSVGAFSYGQEVLDSIVNYVRKTGETDFENICSVLGYDPDSFSDEDIQMIQDELY